MRVSEWDDRYRSGQRGQEQEPAPLVTRFVSSLRPGRALDLACGAGRHAVYLANLGWDVTAVDGSAAALEILEERAQHSGVQVRAVVTDLEQDDRVIEPAAFDLILTCYYLQRGLFPAILAGTRVGGMVVAIVHLPEGDEEANDNRAAPGELRSIFTGWRILHDYEGAPEDPAHRRRVAEIVAMRPEPVPLPTVAPRFRSA